ncbi:hypothetical protein KC717_05310 [Candidatus Dojkabacteria bacterium]|uniref:Uncharacterized protein n=1 Tax=Candidatus Dojkabacteria bacterium TaxID=2099670 RepID=A0A955RL79_9BACT|nr:hypothetical protein [Candidatus Dojkabacteria bacterium]
MKQELGIVISKTGREILMGVVGGLVGGFLPGTGIEDIFIGIGAGVLHESFNRVSGNHAKLAQFLIKSLTLPLMYPNQAVESAIFGAVFASSIELIRAGITR